jgi:hypothetical protein
MDEPAKHKAAYNSNQPQGQQTNKQCPQHRLTLNMVLSIAFSMVRGRSGKLQSFESGTGNRELLYR